MTRTLTTLKVILLVDNASVASTTLKLSPLYNGQFGAAWQGHRVEAKVEYVGNDTAHAPVAPCGQDSSLSLSDLASAVSKSNC